MTEHSLPGSFESFLARWQTLGKGYRLRFRMDGAFFKQSVVEVLASRKAEYAIKVPFWQFLDLHSQIRKCRRWTNAGKDVQGFFTTIHIKTWDRKFRVGIFRKRIHHKPANSYQLELLEMNEENWEYSAIATNPDLMSGGSGDSCADAVHTKRSSENSKADSLWTPFPRTTMI